MLTAGTATRLYYLDWLRIAAFGLLVAYHVGMVYVPWGYHVKHQPSYAALEPFMRLTNPWRMSLIFMISGLATGLMLGRAGLLRERARRLLWPLLLGVAVVVPPQAYVQAREQFAYAGGYAEFLGLYFRGYEGFCQNGDCLTLPTWNHLWFLPYLFLYTAVLWALWRWAPRERLRALVDALANALARFQGLALLLLPIAALALLRITLLPRFPETHALVGDRWAHATYGLMFALGVLLARRPRLLQGFEALRWPALLLAVAAWSVVAAASVLLRDQPLNEWQRAPLRLAYCTEQWAAIVAAFGFARRHWNRDHPWRAPLNEAVYPLYIVHQTIIVCGFVALRPLQLPAGGEALLLAAVTFAGGLLAWRLARRLGPLRPWMGLAPKPFKA